MLRYCVGNIIKLTFISAAGFFRWLGLVRLLVLLVGRSRTAARNRLSGPGSLQTASAIPRCGVGDIGSCLLPANKNICVISKFLLYSLVLHQCFWFNY